MDPVESVRSSPSFVVTKSGELGNLATITSHTVSSVKSEFGVISS